MLTNNEQDIREIIDGCKKDDRQAQEQLYRRFYRAMMTLCLRYTKNSADALEALNTGFYKVYKNIERYNDQQASLYTWIRTIIINSCMDFIHSREKNTKMEELNEALHIDLSPSVISKMSADEILGFVRELPPATQAVFNLYVMEGYNHKDIATLMKISTGTSKWHLNEARKRLQKMINERHLNE